jgi:hypothetical protein
VIFDEGAQLISSEEMYFFGCVSTTLVGTDGFFWIATLVVGEVGSGPQTGG